MKSDYYICKYHNSCQGVGSRRCLFGTPISKIVLDESCNGHFNPKCTVFCDHPNVHVGVLLIRSTHNNIEGNYHNIWPGFLE